MRKHQKLLSAATAACLAASLMTVPAMAATSFQYVMPEEPVNVEGSANVLTTLTQRAASEIPLIFGLNVLGGNMFPGLQYVGGTAVNTNPDPYIWNFNYMWPDYERMSEPGPVAAGRQELPEGTYYKYLGNTLNNPNGLYSSGGANQNYSVIMDELGGVGYAVGYRSDVIIGFNSSTVDQIDLVRSWTAGDDYYQEGDESYSPLIIDVQTGSVTSRLYSWTEMGQALSAYLKANPGKTTRYEDPYTIAVNLEEFSAGIPYYIASLIADGAIEKKTAAYVKAIDGYTLTCVDPSTLGNVAADVYAEVHNFNFLSGNFSLADLMNRDVDLIILGASGYGYTADSTTGAAGGGQAVTNSDKRQILIDLAGLGYTADQVPMIMDANTIQVTIGTNGYNFAPTTPLFMPYVQAYAYMDELQEVNKAINPVAMVQYMFEEFCHVEAGSADEVALYYIGSCWDSVDENYDRVPTPTDYTYNKSAIESAIKEGISYALSGRALTNGNTLLPAIRENENAYIILTEHTTTKQPEAGHDYITLTVGGQPRYLDLTDLASIEGEVEDEPGDGEQLNEYYNIRTEYQAILDYYGSGNYGYGDDLQTTLQKYADRMVAHVWTPDTTAKDTYGYGMGSPAPSFTDVEAGGWYANAVDWAVINGVTSGTGDRIFSPMRTCTVSEILTFLWHAVGDPEPESGANPFAINEDAFYYKAALWALENGVIDDSGFEPSAPCTRAMTVEYLWKASGSLAASAQLSFTDVGAEASYAPAVSWAVEKGITTGTGDGSTFSPDNTCTRAEIVTFLLKTFG